MGGSPVMRETSATRSLVDPDGRTQRAPSRFASSRWNGYFATATTSVSGKAARKKATAARPSVPQPYTSAFSPGAGGALSTAWRLTEKGSAITACSYGTSSGMRNSCDSCAGKSGAKAPPASRQLPMCSAGERQPSAKCSQR